MRTELVTTLKRRATDLLAAIERDKKPILITQHGLPNACLVDVESYQLQQERMAILEGIARGEVAIAEKRTLTQSSRREATWQTVEIVWTEPAIADLEAVADDMTLENAPAASARVQRMIGHVHQLQAHPESRSRPRELGSRTRYRQIIEQPCRIFHRFNGTQVFVVHVLRTEHLLYAARTRASALRQQRMQP